MTQDSTEGKGKGKWELKLTVLIKRGWYGGDHTQVRHRFVV